ncbi:MAG: hypothetical protein FWD14_01820 [Treponema sp.]|nr:hypothetical protein [Treponema sp.]
MAIITENWGHNFRHHGAPLDENTIFETLEQIDNQNPNIGIPNNERFKGQKFIVKTVYEKDENGVYIIDEDIEGDDKRINIGPKEFWFDIDYKPAGNPEYFWIYDDDEKWFTENNFVGKNRHDIISNEQTQIRNRLGIVAVGVFNSQVWNATGNTTYWLTEQEEEIIPQPVLYTPDIPEVNLDDIWSAINTHEHIFRVRKPVTALEVGGVKKGDRLFGDSYKKIFYKMFYPDVEFVEVKLAA